MSLRMKTSKAGRPGKLRGFENRAADGARAGRHCGKEWRSLLCKALTAAFVLLVISGLNLEAKKKEPTTKTVSGRVLDPSENGIDGATVTIKDLQTGKSYSTYSQTDGTYHYSDLQPNHDYEIQAVYKGVASEVRQVSSFDTRMRLTVNLTIPPPIEK